MSTFVIGLDGAHWELLDPWIEAGELETLRRIRENGIWGDLKSCLPPVTCPNWKCYSTGKNPGKIGAFWWELLNVDQRAISTVNGSTFDSPEVWDYLNSEGYSTAVVNMPTTYPPRKVDGCMISGGPDAEGTDYTYPKALASELESRYGYQVRPTDKSLLPDKKEEVLEEILRIIDTRFDVALDMVDDHDFVHLTIFYINVLQHYFWRDPAVLRVWKRIDDNLSQVLEENVNVVLMSDHGSNEIKQEFNINAWLRQEGYLVLDSTVSDVFSRLGLTVENAKRVFGTLGTGWYNAAKRVVPQSIQEQVPSHEGEVKRGGKAAKVNWDESVALAGGQGPVYVLDGNNDLREQLIKHLESLTHPELDEGPVEAAYPAEDVYQGDRMQYAPDVVIDQTPGWHIAGTVGSDTVLSPPTTWAAENKRTGLFAMHGPDFATGGRNELSILDLAPTILHLFELSVPESLDGEVPEFVYRDGSRPADTTPERGGDYGGREGEEVRSTNQARERLEDLGYL